MTIDEVRKFISDKNKRLLGDVALQPSDGRSGAFFFRGPIVHGGGQKVGINIWYNPNASEPKLQISYFVDGVGRIYGLCVNKPHDGMKLHKHNGPPKSTDRMFPMT